jgi:hypothetical protein
MVTSQRDPVVDKCFPLAAADGYEPTSSKDAYYNCIAWAASDINIPWWPTPPSVVGAFWPDGAPREATLAAFMKAYATLRYKDCGRNGSLEKGYEKIAIYVGRDGKPTHAARQLYSGVWTSKLGPYKDIQHTSPHALEIASGSPPHSNEYGTVARYMKRKRRTGDLCLRLPGIPDLPSPRKDAPLVKLLRLAADRIVAFLRHP